MALKQIVLKVNRGIRFRPWVTGQVEAELTAVIQPGEDADQVYAETKKDLQTVIEDLEAAEWAAYENSRRKGD